MKVKSESEVAQSPLPLNGEEIKPWCAAPEMYAKRFIYLAIFKSLSEPSHSSIDSVLKMDK